MRTAASADANARAPWLTVAVCSACIATLMLHSGASSAASPPWVAVLDVIAAGGRSTALVADAHEGWRLVSCHFVHTSLIHLVFNLAFLFPVGAALEQVLERRDYALLLACAGFGSAIASLVGTPQVSAGASGLVFGVLGAAVTLGLRHGPRLPRRVRVHFGGWVLPFLLVVLGVSSTNASVDHWSHAGGLVTGLGLGLLLPLEGDAPRSTVRPMMATALAATAVLAAPAIAVRGRGAARIQLADGSSIAVPAAWRARYGHVGELEFTSAGGMVVLSTDTSPDGALSERHAWYASHRLAPLVPAGRVRALSGSEPRAVLTAQASGSAVRYAFERDGIAMVRDVFFLAPQTVLSLEVPRSWASKYDETRDAILGSVRPASGQVFAEGATAAPAAVR